MDQVSVNNFFNKGSVFVILSFCLSILSSAIVFGEEVNLLSAKTNWKKQYVFLPFKVTAKEGAKAKPATPGKQLLPTGWTTIKYDDLDWVETRGADLTMGDGRARHIRGAPQSYFQGTDPFVAGIGLMAMRGKFIIKDAKKVDKLSLDITYRGGYVAYLNGKEISRKSLPKGKIEHTTPSDVYPLDAFVIKAFGKTKPFNWYTHRDKKFHPNWAKRERKSGVIEIDKKYLVDGVNVLAIEMHRSEYPRECKSKKVGFNFATIGIGALSLKADTSADNAVPANKRAGEFNIWSVPTWKDAGPGSFGNQADGLNPVKIAGTQNGTFAGQFMAGSNKSIEGFEVKKSILTGPEGEIGIDNISLKYGGINPTQSKWRFDLLLDNAPKVFGTKNSAAIPVWIFIKVPKETKPGVYKGEFVVSAKDVDPIKVPVEINISDWKLPDLKDFTMPYFIYQSPESLAQHYKVKMWSEEHWVLIEKSLKLMGEFGNGGLIFPLMAETCQGNPEGMIIWEKQADGTYKHDFTFFDRYLKIAMKYHIPERLICVGINVWGNEMRYNNKGQPSPRGKITIKDKAGVRSNMVVPVYGTPEAVAIFRPVLLAIKEKLKAYKVDNKMMYGVGNDKSPVPKQIAMFNKILPGTPWFRESHFAANKMKSEENGGKLTVPVGCTSMVWGGDIPDPAKKRLYGWKYNKKYLKLNFNRGGTECLSLKGFAAPWSFRMWMESTTACGRNGNGRVGADFLHLKINLKSRWKGRKIKSEAIGGSGGTLYGSYPNSGVGQTGLGNNTTDLLGPAKDGPVTTIRFENARLGNQEAETRVFIERAILAKSLSADLLKRCQAHLDERTYALRLWRLNHGKIPLGSFAWRTSNKKLFDLAGEVAKATKK
ncbi:MAG: hypothetical protein COA79_16135 [Planctomycetota bacterium]|nr:MAG: hypothetical protein COA79_16135 [Planctomycetota bacterium]